MTNHQKRHLADSGPASPDATCKHENQKWIRTPDRSLNRTCQDCGAVTESDNPNVVITVVDKEKPALVSLYTPPSEVLHGKPQHDIWRKDYVEPALRHYSPPPQVTPEAENQYQGLLQDIDDLKKEKAKPTAKPTGPRPPEPTLAERMLQMLDNYGSVFSNVLDDNERALWILTTILGVSPPRIFYWLNPAGSPYADEDEFDENEADLLYFDILAGVVGKDVNIETVRWHWPGLLSKDERKETVRCGEYFVRRQRGYMRNSAMRIYLGNVQSTLLAVEPLATSVEALTEAAAAAHGKIYARAEAKRSILSPDPTLEQLEVKREAQKFALYSPHMKSIDMTLVEQETMLHWIDASWNTEKVAMEYSKACRSATFRTVAGFCDRCAAAWNASKKAGKPIRAFEAFVDTFIVDPDTLQNSDGEYEIALALTGKGGAFGDAHIANHFHARSFDKYGRIWYRNTASASEGTERGFGGNSFWTTEHDDEYDGQ